jgi:hypothetical protein
MEHAILSRLPEENRKHPVLYGHPSAGLVVYLLIKAETVSFGNGTGRKNPFAVSLLANTHLILTQILTNFDRQLARRVHTSGSRLSPFIRIR